MADIELVIKIPKETYEICVKDDYFFYNEILTIRQAIKNGTPLPKNHGILKDIGKCDRKLFYQQCGGANSLITVKKAFDMLMLLPTIIEAESEDKE